MWTRLGVTFLLAAALQTPALRPTDSGKAFLMTAFNLSAADVASLDRGEVVSRTLEAKHRREVATLGIIRVKTAPAVYVERLADITKFKRTEDVLQIGVFGLEPQPADVASLHIDDGDVKLFRGCRVEDCELRLPAEIIERARQGIDWRAADAPGKAAQLLRQMLVDYVARYRQGGAAAGFEYADRKPRLNVASEFAAMIAGDPVTSAYAGRLRQHLLDYPRSSVEKVTDFVYWSKERVRGRPVISITHVATVAAGDDSPVAYAIGSKQIYAMHYYDASLGLTLLVPDRTAPGTYIVYLNRSRIDLFDGMFGGVARRIVASRAKGVVAEQLQRLQRVLAADTSTEVSPRAK